MLKKKNMAMIMAGVTVATSVAPVFANNVAEGEDKNYSVNKKDSAKLVEEVRKALNVKFEDAKAGAVVGDRVYSVKLVTKDLTKEITNATELQNRIDKLVAEGDSLEVVIQDKGHQTIDNKIVDYKFEQYKSVEEIVKAAQANGLVAKAKSLDTVEVKEDEDSEDVITVKVGDDKLKFDAPIRDKENKLTGFKKLPVDIESGIVHTVKVFNSNAVLSSVDAANLFDGLRLTSEGRKLVDKKENAKTVSFENEFILDPGFGQADQKAKFDIVITDKKDNVERITISNEDEHLVRGLRNILEGQDAPVGVLAGDSRFETAIEVSKEGFADGTANAVVLVGQDAVVDGLASAPLAAKKKAPILLAKKDGLTKETEAEMLRVLGNTNLSTKTIYIIGGESQISKATEEKLAKLGVKVERLAGETRYETSLAIAKAVDSTNENAYIVGGHAEADAMSIAAKAAQANSPIVVVSNGELNEETKKFLNQKQLEIIGGTNSLSSDVETELAKIDKDKSVTRIAGLDRQETNAKVINKYYSQATEMFVAKDGKVGGTSQLIDALTAAPLAGSKKAPIVLSTNNISQAQEETIELKLTKVNKVTQIGEGIAKSVVEKLGEVLNLF